MLTTGKHSPARIPAAALPEGRAGGPAAFNPKSAKALFGLQRAPLGSERFASGLSWSVSRIAAVGYHVADAGKVEWGERAPTVEGHPRRTVAEITDAAELKGSRARVWRYPPGTRGRRHADKVQEEVFV